MMSYKLNQVDEYFLSTEEQNEIRTFALNNNTKAGNQAKGFMFFYYNEDLFDKEPNAERRANNPKEEKTKISTSSSFKVKNNFLNPNPAKDFVYVNVSNKNGTIKIFNAIGELILLKEIDQATNKIDLVDLSNGIYFIENNERKEMLIVQH